MRILVVEDESSLSRLITRFLSLQGHQALAVGSAEAALEAYEAERGSFDLVLSDVRLAGLSGVDLMEKVRRIRPGQRVVLMSGHSDLVKESGVMRDPPDAVLSKPFRPQQLTDLLERLQNT